MTTEVNYLEQKDISYYHWDLCVSRSMNSSIYGYTWFLNTVTEDWDALIADDYKMVMPLPLRENMTGTRIMQPLYCPYLGIYTTGTMSPEIVRSFLKAIPHRYGRIDLVLNKFNNFESTDTPASVTQKYELDLIAGYDTLAAHYTPELKTNLQKARDLRVSASHGLLPNEFLALAKNTDMDKTTLNASIIRMIIATSIRYKMGKIYTAFTPENNLCAAVLLLKDKTQLIKYMSIETAEGKEHNAGLLLTDTIIRDYAEKPFTMSFEGIGSKELMTPDCFGATKSMYPRYKKWRIIPIFI